MIKWLYCCCLLLLFAGNSYAQNTYKISGVVKDKDGKTIPGAGVYLGGYKKATVTDADGKFSLNEMAAGSYDVLVQMMGYLPYNKNVIIAGQSVTMDIVLKENTIQLNEVVIQADPNRERYIQMFKESFIGKTPNSAQCKILNPQVIQTDFDKDHRILRVTANEFLIIENKALGYRIKYMLEYFEQDFVKNVIFYGGHPVFEELPASTGKKKKWINMREIAYQGSSQHFFRSLYENRTAAEGFVIHKLVKVPNKNRLPDSLINANLNRLYKPGNTIVRIGPGMTSPLNDSIGYWLNQRDKPRFISILNRADVLPDTLAQQLYKDVKTMNFSDELYVIFTKERETDNYTSFSGHSIGRPLDIANYQISTMHILEGPVHFYAYGGIFNPKSVLMAGFWAYEKIADMVPMDYTPLTRNP